MEEYSPPKPSLPRPRLTALIAAIGASVAMVLLASLLSHSAGLRGPKAALVLALIGSSFAALVGAMLSMRSRFGSHGGFKADWAPRLLVGGALLVGLAIGLFLGTENAGFAYLPSALLRLVQSALIGAALGECLRLICADRWVAGVLAALFVLFSSSLALWGDQLLVNDTLSSEAFGAIGIRHSPALRIMDEGLGIEIVTDELYLEAGYLIKDHTPEAYYGGMEWSWLLAPLLWLGIAGLRRLGALLKASYQKRKAEKLGINTSEAAQ